MEITYISSPSNLLYYSSLKNDDARILLCEDKKYYITDARFISVAQKELKDFVVILDDKFSILEKSIEVIKKLNPSILRVEGNELNMLEYLKLKSSLRNLEIIDDFKNINKKRISKNQNELNFITKAQEITDLIYMEIVKEIYEGITEIELAELINKKIYIKKCTPSFDTIVAFGENSASPHSIPTNKKLEIGNAVVIDFGVKYNHYCSDMTRSFSYKTATDEYIKAYNNVLSTQNKAINNVKMGIKVSELDNIARESLGTYQQYFNHSLGHGVGIDIHENPRLSKFSEEILELNCVITIEPGIYIKNKFGIRIEDLIVVQQQSALNLTKSPKNMIIK